MIEPVDLETYRSYWTACPYCGRWKCANCGHQLSRANKLFSGVRTCPRCKHTEGEMLDTRHYNYYTYLDHVEAGNEMSS